MTNNMTLTPEQQKAVDSLVKQLNITEQQATSLVFQELKRKAAGERYRTSEAYKLRLEQQKMVRKVLKAEAR